MRNFYGRLKVLFGAFLILRLMHTWAVLRTNFSQTQQPLKARSSLVQLAVFKESALVQASIKILAYSVQASHAA
jgi:hypothetical protein